MIYPLAEVDDGGSSGCIFTALKIHYSHQIKKYLFSNVLT